jgi:N-formylglutamate deformylase
MERTDDTFLEDFENCELPESEFDHRGHLRLAWLYLERYPLDEAIRRTSDGIRSYAANLGAASKFHRTVTEAIVRIMHRRQRIFAAQNFNEFLTNNPDLSENMKEILLSHYSSERLESEEGKACFLEPDLRDF